MKNYQLKTEITMTEPKNQTNNDTSFNPTETDERAYLTRVTGKIGDSLQSLSQIRRPVRAL